MDRTPAQVGRNPASGASGFPGAQTRPYPRGNAATGPSASRCASPSTCSASAASHPGCTNPGTPGRARSACSPGSPGFGPCPRTGPGRDPYPGFRLACTQTSAN